MTQYEIWTPWDEVIEHGQLIYLNETDGRLDLYYHTLEESVVRVLSANYKLSANVAMVDDKGNDITPARAKDIRIYVLKEANALKMRTQDIQTLLNEVGMYEDNFLTEGED